MGVSPQQIQAILQAAGRLGTAGGVQGAGSLGTVGNIYGGLASGTTQGDIAAAANLAKLGGQTGWYQAMGATPTTVGQIGTGATGALDALAIAQGLKQGGVQGYGQAAGAGLQGAGLLMSNPALTQAGGAVMAPLATYNAIKNYQSGNTGQDALQGAEAGAAWGSIAGPEGALIGALIGGAVGGISSAFGGGRPDPETGIFQNYASALQKLTPAEQAQVASSLTPQQAFTNLAGIMDAKRNEPGHSESIEQVFGRMGEGNLMSQMGTEINRAVQAGQITPGESMQQQWSQVLDPWFQSKGVKWDPTSVTSKGTPEYAPMVGDIQQLASQYESGALTPQTQVGLKGQTMGGGLLPFTGWGSEPLATQTSSGNVGWAAGAPQQQTAVPSGNVGWATGKARGGRMSGLDHIYRGRFADRQHFQDGGSAYFDYTAGAPAFSASTQAAFDPTSSSFGTDPAAAGTLPPIDMSTANTLAPTTDVSGGFDPTQTITMSNGMTFNPSTGNVYDPSTGKTTNVGPTSSSSGTPGILQQIANIGKGFIGLDPKTGNINLSTLLKNLGTSAPAIARLMGLGTAGQANVNPPVAAPGMTQGATAPRAPIFNRAPIPGGQVSNLPGGAPMTTADWYTYGSRPGAQFFTNNQVPLAYMTGVSPTPPTTGGARGGRSSALDSIGPEFHSSQQSFAQGPGDGTSDNIPAQLSDGEYVMDANTVSLLGNGSNRAGAERLDQLRENVRRSAAKPMAKGKQFMKAKAPAAYMGRRS